MWEFIKSLFKKEEPLPKEEVDIKQLETWIDEKTKPVIEDLNKSLDRAKQAVAEEIQNANNNIKHLEEAQLKNPDIPERAKHFMQGNREAYIKKISFFLNSIHFPNDIKDFNEFHAAVQKELQELAKGTARPFQILQEFLADESRKVGSSVGVIEKEINQLNQAADTSAIHLIDTTKQMINDYSAKKELKQKLTEEKNAVQEKYNELEKTTAKLENDILLLSKDKQLNELKERQKQVKSRIEEVRERITGPFSTIDTAMRKFERITYRHREIMQKYIESPLDALMKDLHLGILKALADMQMAITNNRIELKDRKKAKTLETLKLLTKDYLGSFLTEYGQIKKEEDKIAKAIQASEVVLLMNEKKEIIKKSKIDIEDTKRKIEFITKELEKIDLEETYSELIKNLRKITKTEVTIKL